MAEIDINSIGIAEFLELGNTNAENIVSDIISCKISKNKNIESDTAEIIFRNRRKNSYRIKSRVRIDTEYYDWYITSSKIRSARIN